jgi:ornithine carbamoyltransferase
MWSRYNGGQTTAVTRPPLKIENKETNQMQTNLRGRDLIGDLDFSKEEVETVMDVAFDLKRKRALNELHPYLRDKVLAMLFFFSSTRTRGSFEAGAQLAA